MSQCHCCVPSVVTLPLTTSCSFRGGIQPKNGSLSYSRISRPALRLTGCNFVKAFSDVNAADQIANSRHC